MTEETRCQYQSTNCENPRARRDNGELHRLCEFHRDKANETQRRWHNRHKESLRPTASTATPAKTLTAFERRALARLMEAADRETYKAARSVKRRRCSSELDTSTIKSEPNEVPTFQDAPRKQFLKNEATSSDPESNHSDDSDLDSNLSDHEIEGLTALVMEYNAQEEPQTRVDTEFIEMLDAWYQFTHCSVRQT